MKDYNKALPYYLEATELKEKYNQRKSLANTLNNIDIILKNQDKQGEAIPYYLKLLAIAQEFNDLNKQGNLVLKFNVADVGGRVKGIDGAYNFTLSSN